MSFFRKANIEIGSLSEFDSNAAASGTIAASTTSPLGGKYSIRANATSAGGLAYCEWTTDTDMANTTNGCNLSARIKIDSSYSLGADANLFYLLTMVDADDTLRASAFIYVVSSMAFLVVLYNGASSDAHGWDTVLTLGTTYHIELSYKAHASTGHAKIYVNGSLVHNMTSLNTAGQVVKKCCVGLRINTGTLGIIDFDDAVLSNAVNGIPGVDVTNVYNIYSTDFETNSKSVLSDELLSGAGSTLAISTTQARGTYSLEAHSGGDAAGDLAEGFTYMSPNVPMLLATFWAYVSVIPDSNNAYEYLAVIHQGSTNSDLFLVGIQQNGAAGTFRPIAWKRNGAGAGDFDTYAGNNIPNLTSSWVEFKFFYHRHATAGEFWVEVNNTRVMWYTGLDTTIGGELTSFSVIAQHSTGASTVYFDDITLTIPSYIAMVQNSKVRRSLLGAGL